MPEFAGMPEGAEVIQYAGMPEGAEVIDTPAPKSVDHNFGGVSFGKGKPVDTRKISYTKQRKTAAESKQAAKDLLATGAKMTGGAVRGATFGVVKADKGTIGIPFTTKEFGPGIGTDSLVRFIDPSADVAESRIPEAVGAILGGVASGPALLKKASNVASKIPLVGKFAPLREGLVGSVTGAAMPREEDQSILTPFLLGGALGTMGGSVESLLNFRPKGGAPFSDKRARTEAGKVLRDRYATTSDEAAANQTKTLAESEAVLARAGVTQRPTNAQMTGSYTGASFEQSTAAKNPVVGEKLKYNDANVNMQALRNIERFLGKRPAPSVSGGDKQAIGAKAMDTLKDDLGKVTAQEQEVWAAVPQYEIPTPSVDGAVVELNSLPMEKTVKETVGSVTTFIKSLPKNTQGLQSADRTIQARITEAQRAGRNDIAHELKKLKAAVDADFKAMGDAAEVGDVALLNNRIVYPSQLEAEIKQIDEALAARTPGLAPAKLAQRRAEIEGILTELQPAENVAGAYSAAKKFSKEQKFDRFGRGAVNDVLKRGDEYSGYQLPMESIPRNFATPTGADDFIRAVGKEKAAPIMEEYARTILAEKAIDADGNLLIPRAMAFLRQNKQVLGKYGIQGNIEKLIRDSVPDAVRRTIEKLPPDILGNPKATVTQIRRITRDFGPALKYLYRDQPGAYQSLTDYHKIIEILARNKNVSAVGGSTTVEKGMSDILDHMGQFGAVAVGRGWQYSAVKNILKHFSGYHGMAEDYTKRINDLLGEAIFNPELAKDLMAAAKTADSKAAPVQKFLAKYLPAVTYAGEEKRDRQGYRYENGELIPNAR